MPIGGQLGGRLGGQPGGQVLPSMVSSATSSQIAAEQTKQKELQTYIERVAAGQDKPQTVNITYYERPHPRDPNTVIVGYRATTDQPLRFQSNYTSYETQVKAGTDYKQALEKTALQGVKAYYHLGADDTIAIQGKVVQSPTYSPQVIGIAQQVAQEKQAYDVKLASLREQQQAQLKAGITFQAEQTAKIQELQAKTTGMSPTQAADYLKGELKGYYGKEVLAGVRYTVGDKTFSDPKMAERYAAQLSQQQAPQGLPQDILPPNVLPQKVLKPIFVGGKPNVELFPETFYSPKYGLMTKPVSEPTLPIEQIQKEFGGINLSVISTASRKYGEIGAEKIRKSIFDTSFLPKEIKESRGMKALYTITPYARESTARLVSFGGMVIPTTEVIGRTAISKPALIPKLVLTGAILTAGGISESIQKEPRQFLADILVSAGTMKGLSMGTGFVIRKTPTAIKFGESVIRTQKPMMRSFLKSETASIFEPTEAQKIALEKGTAGISERGVMGLQFGSRGYRPTGTPKPVSGLIAEYMGRKTAISEPIIKTEPTIKKTPKIGEDWVIKRNKELAKSLKGLTEPIIRAHEEPLAMVKVKTETVPFIRKMTMVQERQPVVLESLKGLKTFEEMGFASKEAKESYLKGMGVIPISATSYREKQSSLTKTRIIKRVLPGFVPSRTTRTTVRMGRFASSLIEPTQAVSSFVFIQPRTETQISPQLSPQTMQKTATDLLIGEKMVLKTFPSFEVPEEFFRRKGRRRKEKAKKGSVIAPIITPAQILRGGVLFRGNLLRRARRFK